jgi:hypothetical protein
VRWASTGVDRRRGLPNNHLRDPAGIPDFHPQFHLINDAGKLSRLMVATRKYKETYDMQASRWEATWFNTQKPVVNNYALGILVLRSQYLLEVLTSIASRNLTVTDTQPNTHPLRQPNQTNPNQNPVFPLIMWGFMPLITVSMAVITVLHSAEVVHVTRESWLSSNSWILVVSTSTLTHFQGVRQDITTRLFNSFI